MFLVTIALMLLSSVVISYLILSDPEKAKARRAQKLQDQKDKNKPALAGVHDYVSRAMEKRQEEKKKSFYLSDEELELSGTTLSPGAIVTYTGLASIVALFAASFFTNLFYGILAFFFTWWVVRFNIRRKVKKVQKKFEKQLEQALRVIASSLVSGQSLQGSFISVANDAEEPMAGEMTRVVNETRIGKDLIESLNECARRMNSEDFEWFASAAELQRATGGNLTEIIETVSETIRERSELRAKIHAYASEGRASSYLLMAIPVVLALVFAVLQPGYFDPMLASFIGKGLVGLCAVLYLVSYAWMKKLVQIKV